MASITRQTSLAVLLGLVVLVQGQASMSPIGSCVPNPNTHVKGCGTRGNLNFSAPNVVFNNQTVQSMDECVYLAFLYTWEKLAYNETSNLCTLYQAPFSGKFWTPDNSSDTAMAADGCYTCTPYSNITAGTNLLADGGFEYSPDYSGPWFLSNEQASFPLVSPGSNSPTAMLLYDSDSNRAQIQQVPLLVQNKFQTYYLSFDWKYEKLAGGPANRSTPYFTLLNNAAKYYLTENTTWQTALWTMQQNDQYDANAAFFGMTIEFNDYTVSNGTLLDRFYVDNIVLSEVPQTSIPRTRGPNLINNPGFESGKFGPWGSTNSKIVSAKQIYHKTKGSNKYAVEMDQAGNQNSELSQTVSGFKVNKPYLFSFDYRTTSRAFPPGALFFFGSPNAVHNLGTTTLVTDEITTLRSVVMPNAGNITFFWAYDGLQPVYVDNFSAKEVICSPGNCV